MSSSEAEHTLPIRLALEMGKTVLVEKPLALSLKEADDTLETLSMTGGSLRVGYSRRFKDVFLRAKEQIVQGRLGRITGALGRVYNGQSQAFAILKRDPHATPVIDVSRTTWI